MSVKETSAICILMALAAWPALAQGNEDVIETAKPADTVSPYGVSYVTGSFTYKLPLLSVGEGEWPDRMSISLIYDSSANRPPNEAWKLSSDLRASRTFLRYAIDGSGDEIPEDHNYAVYFVSGNSSQSFEIGTDAIDPQQFRAVSNDGSSLAFTEWQPGNHNGFFWDQYGEFVITDSVGNQAFFKGGIRRDFLEFDNVAQARLVMANGNSSISGTITSYKYHRNGKGLLIFEGGYRSISSGVHEEDVCVYNLAKVDVSQITDCSQSSAVATVRYERFPDSHRRHVTRVTRPDGSVYNFSYTRIEDIAGPTQSNQSQFLALPKVRYQLSCVKEPGQTGCAISNTYDACDGPGLSTNGFDDIEWTGSRDRVIQQTLGDGRVINYSYPGQFSQQRPCRDRHISSIVMTEASLDTEISLTGQPGSKQTSRVVGSVTDPLQRISSYEWTGANPAATYLGLNHALSEVTYPGGIKQVLTYDARGNLIEVRRKAKPGSAIGDLVSTATFPQACLNRKTCNKPTSTTDPDGNVTEFEYDTVHGGILKQTGPADADGVRSETRYSYAQKYAWLKSGFGYVQSTDPIWMLVSEEYCQTSSADANGNCTAGASDEVVTTYEYEQGSATKGSNILLLGMAVTTGGQTLRTCYEYDGYGRKISETQPKAGLASCQ